MHARRTRSAHLVVALALIVAAAMAIVSSGQASAAEPTVGLGTTQSFAVLGGSTVTNTGPSLISGDVGLSPGSAITGFPPGVVVNGTIHGTAASDQAQADLTTAYDDAAGRSPSGSISADLAGQTLTAGVYAGPTLSLNGTLTFDAQGDASSVFIMQASSTLITGSASSVRLVNGADPCNVFWQVGSSATLGTASSFVGTILALTSITADTSAVVSGRLLARNGAVTLDSNTISTPTCDSSTTTVPPTTQPGTTQPPTTQPGTTQPPTTQPPTTQPGTTQPPTTQPGTTQPPTTQPGTTQPPTTQPPTTQPGTTQPPTTQPPTTQPPSTQPPSTVTTPSTSAATSTTQPLTTTAGPSSTGTGGGTTSGTTGSGNGVTSGTSGAGSVGTTGSSGTTGSTTDTSGSTGQLGTSGTTGTTGSTGTSPTTGSLSLARTGSDLVVPGVVGLVALALGSALLVASRRRRLDG